MTILLILLILLFVLVLLKLLYQEKRIEGFEAAIPLNPDTVQGYKNFLAFYNPFCANWQKAIVSSIAADTPQEPLTSPSQVSDSGSGGAATPSSADMNTYINQLSQQLGQPLPPVCTTMPDSVDSTNIGQIIPLIPTDTTPFINALNWMNKQLEKAHSGLGTALQGGKPQTEGFDDATCQNMATCLANDPALIAQLAQELAGQNAQAVVQQEQQLMAAMIPFLSTQALSEAFGQNTLLIQKSQDIQNQAQSGQLVNQINVPGGNTRATYTKPDGSDNLAQMEKNNPDRAAELKANYGQWYAIKQLTDQINATL
jgi:hypothetical protein